jgi:hypothetical protein
MLLRKHSQDQSFQPAPPPDASTPPNQAGSQNQNPNVIVSHGIHRGQFPIRGLTVRDARQTLERVMPIASDAIPVINGQAVDENLQIGPDVSLLSFVKPSSLRGAGESIRIEGKEARLNGHNGEEVCVPVDDFSLQIGNATLQGLYDVPLPDNIRWLVQCGIYKVAIFELRPELRKIDWIVPDSPAPYGPESVTAPRRLATPFVVVKVPFRRDRLFGRIEVFYRNERLQSADGDGGALFVPNLLNLSPWSHDCVCWYCTQYVDFAKVPAGVMEGLHFVANFIFSGKLNYSSEANEGKSGFSMSCAQQIDPRVTDIDRWEEASVADRDFVLSIPWIPARVTVRELIRNELKYLKAKPAPSSASDLGTLILRREKPK